MTKIYESPDGGKTIYEREVGETARTEVYVTEVDEHDVELIDYETGEPTVYSNKDVFQLSDMHPDWLTYPNHKTEEEQIMERLDNIEKRLTILVPDDKMLKKYQVLQDLYDQYKAAEALLFDDNEDEQ